MAFFLTEMYFEVTDISLSNIYPILYCTCSYMQKNFSIFICAVRTPVQLKETESIELFK